MTGDNEYTFRTLTTQQFKRLVQTVIDSSLGQANFIETVFSIISENKTSEIQLSDLTIIDKLLFVLSSRMQAVSQDVFVNNENETVKISITDIQNRVYEQLASQDSPFAQKTIVDGEYALIVSAPTIVSEIDANNAVYRKMLLDDKNAEHLQQMLGEAFVVEITKHIKSIQISNETLNLAELDFDSRLRLVNDLPASLVQKVIEYAEKAKKAYESCLTFNGSYLIIDGSFFSVY